MSQSGNQADHNPTQRLLELIRRKGQNQESTGSAPNIPASNNSLDPPRLFTPKNIPYVGIELADEQLKIAGSISNKGQTRLFLWQVHDFPYKLHSENISGQLRHLLADTLAQPNTVAGQRFRFWASYEFSKEEFHIITLPVMKKKDLPTALTWTLKRQLDVDLDQLCLDFEVLGQVTENRVQKYQILAVLVDRSEVTGLQKVFSRAGYPLSGITPAALANLNIFRSKCVSPSVPNVGLVHIGRSSSRIALFSHQRLLLHRKIRVGLHTLLEDVPYSSLHQESSPAQTEPEDQNSEHLLLNFLLQPNREQEAEKADEIISSLEPGVDRLIRQVERTLSYHTRNLGHDPIQRLYLSGRLSAAPRIQSQFSRTLDLEIKVLDAFAGNISLATPQPASQAQRLELGTTLGLSLARPGQTLNLLHTSAQQTRDTKVRQAKLAGIAVIICIMSLLGGYHMWQLMHLNSQRNILEEKKDQIRRLEARLGNMKNQVARIQPGQDDQGTSHLLSLIDAKYGYWQEYATRFKPVACLSEIFALLPDTVRIKNVFAYLQDQGPKISLRLNSERSSSTSQRVLYSDSQVGITQNQERTGQKLNSDSLDTILMVKGMITGREHNQTLILSRLRKQINASPLFQVLDSIEQEQITPASGSGIQFHLLLKVL
jgi:Tfp pilus assembly PilM family ATPase